MARAITYALIQRDALNDYVTKGFLNIADNR